MSKDHDKKIVIFFQDMGVGGIQRKIIDIINSLSEKESTQIALIYRDSGSLSILSQINNSKCTLYKLPRFAKSKKVLKYFQIISFIYFVFNFKPDVIFTFLQFNLPYVVFAKYILRIRRKKTKLILGMDNILSLYNRKPHSNTTLPNSVLKFLFQFTDQVITQTKYAKNDLVKNFDVRKEKISVIPNWGPVTIFLQNDQPPLYDLIFLGRFVRQKRVEKIVDLVHSLKKSQRDIKVAIVGGGAEESYIKDLIRMKKLTSNVLIKKPTHNNLQFLKKAKIMILTSEFEGHPMVLLEAMALGICPVILNYPGLSEYLIDGETGYIPKNTFEMEAIILRLLKNPLLRKIVGKNAQNEIKNKYNKDLISQTTQLF